MADEQKTEEKVEEQSVDASQTPDDGSFDFANMLNGAPTEKVEETPVENPNASGADASKEDESQSGATPPSEKSENEGAKASGDSKGQGADKSQSKVDQAFSRRINRAKEKYAKQYTKLESRIQELEKENQELKSNPAEAVETPAEEVDAGSYAIPSPTPGSYDEVDDYLEDYELWSVNKPLKHDPKGHNAKLNKSEEKKAEQKEPEAPIEEPKDPALDKRTTKYREARLEIIEEILESDANLPDQLLEDFGQMLEAGRFKLTADMLDWMVNHVDKCSVVVSRFVNEPHLSKVMALKKPSELDGAMSELSDLGLAEEQKAETQPVKPNVPVYDPLTGGNVPLPKDLDELPYNEYEKERKAQIQQGTSGFGLSF